MLLRLIIRLTAATGLWWIIALPVICCAQDTQQKPEDLFKSGQECLDRRDFHSAQNQLEQFLAQYPAHTLEPQALVKLSECYFSQRQYELTIATLNTLLKKYPNRSSAKIYQLLAGSFFGLKDCSNALVYYQQIIAQYPEAPHQESVYYHLAVCSFYLNQNETAELYLKAIPASLPPLEQANRLALTAYMTQQKQDLKSALELWLQVYSMQVIPDEESIYTQDDLRQKIEELIDGSADESMLATLIQTYPNKFPGDVASLHLAQMKRQQSHYQDALDILNKFLANFPQHPQGEWAADMQQELKQSLAVNPNKIGLIVPLSGKYKAFGQTVQRGVELALAQVNQTVASGMRPEDGNNKIILEIKDCQGSPVRAAEVVRQLAQEGAIAVIGPVLSKSVSAAGAEAKELEIPLITPAAPGQGVILDDEQPYVFRNSLTNQQQGEAAAKFAIENMCLTSFAILYPQNPYGQEMARIFAETVKAYGCKLVGGDSYQDKATDFRKPIETVLDRKPRAIYIPDSSERVVLIAPQLVFYAPAEENVSVGSMLKDTAIQSILPPPRPRSLQPFILLGVHDWLSPQLLKDGGRYMDKAVFPCGFNVESASPQVQEFVHDFEQRFGQKPDLLAAQAYDSTRIVIKALKGCKYREELRDALLKIQDYQGITGITSFTPQGDSIRRLPLIGIRQSKFKELAGHEDWLCQNPPEPPIVELLPVPEPAPIATTNK